MIGQTAEETLQSISPTGDAYREFRIQKATAWPGAIATR
jgi:hypothetical protein